MKNLLNKTTRFFKEHFFVKNEEPFSLEGTLKVAPLIMAGVQAGMGIYQMVQAKKEAQRVKDEMEEYEVSTDVAGFNALAKNELNALSPQAKEGMAQSRQAAADVAAATNRNATTGADALAGSVMAGRQAQGGIAGAIQFENQDRARRINNVATGANMMAREEQLVNASKNNIAQQSMQARDNMIGAGIQNVSGAVSGYAAAKQEEKRMEMLKDIFGGGAVDVTGGTGATGNLISGGVSSAGKSMSETMLQYQKAQTWYNNGGSNMLNLFNVTG